MWLFIILLACAIALLFFFFNDTATTEIYTLSLHDALLISNGCHGCDRIAHSAGRTGISTGMSTGLPASSTPGTVVSKTPSTRLGVSVRLEPVMVPEVLILPTARPPVA